MHRRQERTKQTAPLLPDLVKADDPVPLLQTTEGDRAAAMDLIERGSPKGWFYLLRVMPADETN